MIGLKSIFGLFVGAVIGLFVGLPLALIVESLFGENATTVLGWMCMVGGGIIGFAKPIKEESDRRAKLAEEKHGQLEAQQEEERRRLKIQQEEVQRRIEYLSKLLSDSQRTFSSIQSLISMAERHLAKGEEEFAEGAFAPFWDEIEGATNALAEYQHSIKTINGNAARYEAEAKAVPTQVPKFDLPTKKLPDGRPAATRLAATVRSAQKDFHFATIYEQRKTNKILVAGFGTLASAIYAIGNEISVSLSNLSTTLHSSLDDILDASYEHAHQSELASDRLVNLLDEQNVILTKIQRGRK